MATVTVDFGKNRGAVKPMHAVNNGPAGAADGISNAEAFRAAGIPYVRLHDSAHCWEYGGEFTVDVHRIFRDFAADENDPASYIFGPTDRYLADVAAAGAEPFYRLGASIEPGYKCGTYPPADSAKWARISEHIIRHYTEGWADGYTYKITYWEIWNEPDCRNDDGSSPCWQGTEAQFIDFFVTAYVYLKTRFPHLKFGGPAFAYTARSREFILRLLRAVKRAGFDLDFFSFHAYAARPRDMGASIATVNGCLAEAGMLGTETILNEWNYVRGWGAGDWAYSLRAIKGLKGAAFDAAVMCVGQNSDLSMLMYYDLRPGRMNGLFDTDFLQPLKGYYAFKMFDRLYRLKNAAEAVTDGETVYACAAGTRTGEKAVLISRFDDDDGAPPEDVTIRVRGADGAHKATVYLLDGDNDMRPVRGETLPADGALTLTLKNFDTVLIGLEPV